MTQLYNRVLKKDKRNKKVKRTYQRVVENLIQMNEAKASSYNIKRISNVVQCVSHVVQQFFSERALRDDNTHLVININLLSLSIRQCHDEYFPSQLHYC